MIGLFDGHWWLSGPPSGRNVVTSLITVWSKTWPDDELHIMVPPSDLQGCQSQTSSLPNVRLFPYKAWAKSHGLAATLMANSSIQYDFSLSQNFTTILGQQPKITFVHDIIYQQFPEWFTFRERAYLRMIRPLARQATIVVTSSETEARRIGALWPEARDRVHAVGLALPIHLVKANPVPPPDPKAQFLLVVGRLNDRKNLTVAIEAIGVLRRSSTGTPTPHLLIVGERDGRLSEGSRCPEYLAGLEVTRFLGAVTDEQLVWLYQNCTAFIFPSRDEGFGLPLLEAVHYGAPLICSDIAVFREVAPGAAYFDPTDSQSLARAIDIAVNAPPGELNNNDAYTWENVVGNIRGLIEPGPVK